MVCKLRPRSRLDHPSPTRHRNGTHTTLTQSPNYLWYRVAVCPANMINPLKLRSSNQPTSHSYFNLSGRRIASWCLKIRSDAIAVMRQGSVWAVRGAQHPQDHLEVGSNQSVWNLLCHVASSWISQNWNNWRRRKDKIASKLNHHRAQHYCSTR